MFAAPSFPGLRDTSVLQDGRTLSQACGAGLLTAWWGLLPGPGPGPRLGPSYF